MQRVQREQGIHAGRHGFRRDEIGGGKALHAGAGVRHQHAAVGSDQLVHGLAIGRQDEGADTHRLDQVVAEAFGFGGAQVEHVPVLQRAQFGVGEIAIEHAQVGGSFGRRPFAPALHKRQQREIGARPPGGEDGRGALVGAAPRHVQEGRLARHLRREAVLAGEADVARVAASCREQRLGMAGLGEHGIEPRQQRIEGGLVPLRIGQQRIVPRQRQPRRQHALQQQVEVEATRARVAPATAQQPRLHLQSLQQAAPAAVADAGGFHIQARIAQHACDECDVAGQPGAVVATDDVDARHGNASFVWRRAVQTGRPRERSHSMVNFWRT